MNENSPSNTSTSAPNHGLTAEAISRRAYELWEKEGRPESRDLHHWLRAEQELLAEQSRGGAQSNSGSGASDKRRPEDNDWLAPEKAMLQQNQKRAPTPASAPANRQANTDQPMQGARMPMSKPPLKKSGGR